MDALNLFFRLLFTDNLALAAFLGMGSFMALSGNYKTARSMGWTVVLLLLVTVPVNYALERLLLAPDAIVRAGDAARPVDLGFLRFALYTSVVVLTVQLLQLALPRLFPARSREASAYLPLVTVNSAVLGASLLMRNAVPAVEEIGTGGIFVYALGAGLGWLLAILILAAIRERMAYSDVPEGLRGWGIAWITVALAGLGFMIFTGCAF